MAAGDIRAGGAVVEIVADESGLRAGLSRAAARIEGFEKKLKNMFGPRSLLKDAAEIALGGGAVAGVTFAAQAIGDAATKIAELNAEFDKGQLSAGEFAGEIARSIPVLGQMVTMFDQIGAAITGSGAAFARLVEENEKATAAWQAYDKAMANANTRMQAFTPDKVAESVRTIDEAIAGQRNTPGGGARIKFLEQMRRKLAIAEMDAITQSLTLTNDSANKKRLADMLGNRLDRNAINAEAARRERMRARGEAGLQQKAADEFSAAITDHFAKAALDVAKSAQQKNLNNELERIRGQMQGAIAVGMQLPSQLINPDSYGIGAQVKQMKETEAKIIAAIEKLVAN